MLNSEILKKIKFDKNCMNLANINKVDKRKVFALVAAAVLLFVVLICSKSYLGGDSPRVKAYVMKDDGLCYSTTIPRGIKVNKTGNTSSLDDSKMIEIKLTDKQAEELLINKDAVKEKQDKDEASENKNSENNKSEKTTSKKDSQDANNEIVNKFYVSSDHIVRGKWNIVQETELFVRTPLTVYENEDGPEIASAMKKGDALTILKKGKLQEDGTIDMYKVAYTDATGKSGEGYVYGKYVVGNYETAMENYNDNGEYKSAKKAEYSFNLGGGHAKNLDYYPVTKPSFNDNELCTDARTMYINTDAAIHYKSYIKLIESTDCNAVVIDIKDGPLTYKSEVAKEYSKNSYKKAYASVEEFKEGVDAYKSTGVYTIGRIVVFNDSRYAKDHPEDCINDTSWPSAYSRRVWEYNVKLAIEAVETFGFDEIQFDYVRFPESSYELSQDKDTDWKNVYGEEKGQAVQGFCFYACDQIHKHGAYVSVDVFGECSYKYCTAYGQYWPAISNVVDAISSMPYSDHHGDKTDTWTNPYNTLNTWAKRTAKRQKECPTPAVDRTWITGYNTPYWNPTVKYDESKMKEQIMALRDAGLCGGFIPWNVLSDINKYKQYKDIWNEWY